MRDHFNEKDAMAHVVEKRVEGALKMGEAHGTEIPHPLSHAAEAAKESALLFLLLAPLSLPYAYLISLAIGWILWKGTRASWLGWSRLERFHMVIEQERFEIEHHRPQEREELYALYRAKGFEGKLLEEVVEVLMADQDRLLKVMLEEEMGLVLESFDHPLKLGLGAVLGVLAAALLIAGSLFLLPLIYTIALSFLLVALFGMLSSLYEGRKLIASFVWNLSFAALSFGTTLFLYRIFLGTL